MEQKQLKQHVAKLFSRRYNFVYCLEFIGDVEFAYNEDVNFFLFYTVTNGRDYDKRYHCVVTSGDGCENLYDFAEIHYYDSNVISKAKYFDIEYVQDEARRWLLAVANDIDGSTLTIVK